MAGDLVQQQAGGVHGSAHGSRCGFRRWCGRLLWRLWRSGWRLRRHGSHGTARCGAFERAQWRGDAPRGAALHGIHALAPGVRLLLLLLQALLELRHRGIVPVAGMAKHCQLLAQVVVVAAGLPFCMAHEVVEGVGRHLQGRQQFGMLLGDVEAVEAIEIGELITAGGEQIFPQVVVGDRAARRGGFDQDDPGPGSLQTGALQDFAFRAFDVDFEEVDVTPWRVLLQQVVEGLHGDGDCVDLAAALAVGFCYGGV